MSRSLARFGQGTTASVRSSLRLATCVLFSFTGLLAGSSIAFGQEPGGLGKSHGAVTVVPYFGLFDSVLDAFRIDHGSYLGVSYYHTIGRGFYLGGELGYVEPSGVRGLREVSGERGGIASTLQVIPVELNLQYVVDEWRHFAMTFGLGVSGVRVTLGQESPESDLAVVAGRDSSWLPGFQLFIGVNYLFARTYVGFFVKLQMTHDRIFEVRRDNLIGAEDYSNGQAGVLFGWRF